MNTPNWTSPEDADAEHLADEQVARQHRRQDDLDHPALLLLDHPGKDREAEREHTDEDQHRGDVGDQELGLAPSAAVLSRATVGGACAAASVVGSTPALTQHRVHAQPGDGTADERPGSCGSASLWNATSPAFDRSAGTTTRAATFSSPERLLPGGTVGERDDRDVLVEQPRRSF